MKAFKLIALILIAMILFQSCYTRKLTVDQYMHQSKYRKVKIKTIDGQGLSYTRLYIKDSTLYGERKLYGEKVILDLSGLDIVSVKEFSPWKTIALFPAGFLAFVAFFFISIAFS